MNLFHDRGCNGRYLTSVEAIGSYLPFRGFIPGKRHLPFLVLDPVGLRIGLLVLVSVILPSVETMAASPLFPPGSPPAREVCVLDLTTQTLDAQLAVSTLQGQVNSGTTASLYLIASDSDRFWLQHLTARRYVTTTRSLAGIPDLLAAYGRAYDKVVIYDPHLPATINVGMMMAGLDKGVVVAPADAGAWGTGHKIEDLRGRWQTNAEAYRWAFDTLWPQMNHTILACYHPTSCQHALRDYLVRNRVFTFWISGEEKQDVVRSDTAKETALAKEILTASPPNIPVLGFWYSGADPGINEYAGVGLAGEYGKLTVACDWTANLSLLSGIPADLAVSVVKYRKRTGKPAPRLDSGKIYISFNIVESGDSPAYLHSRQYRVWQDPMRGQVPIGWSIGTPAAELEPPVFEYYLDHATPNDYLYLAISGAAYVHPYRHFMARTDNPETAWADYLTLTARYMNLLQCHEMGLYTDAWHRFDRAKMDPVTERFADGIPGLQTLILGMGRDDGMDSLNGNYFVGKQRTHVTHILTRWDPGYASQTREQAIEWLANDILQHSTSERPAFMSVMALSWRYEPSDIVQVLSRLGPDYVAVSPPELTQLYRFHCRFREREGLGYHGESRTGEGLRLQVLTAGNHEPDSAQRMGRLAVGLVNPRSMH